MSKKLRIAIPIIVMAVLAVAYALHLPLGSLSNFGWETISVLCPLGALTTMLASKTLIPHALISLVIAVVAILLLGRAFCGWICPTPVLSRLRYAFTSKSKLKAKEEEAAAQDNAGQSSDKIELTDADRALLKSACRGHGSCASKGTLDSRHLVLGGTLLSAAIFGFPVFCLICPIGLTFATIVLLMLLFGVGDLTLGVIVAPIILLIEVVFFRKWCSHICPLSAIMSLVGKANRTFVPTIDDSKCLETSKGVACGKCSQVCEVKIDPRHPELGSHMSECIKCRACVEACPGHAISMPLVARAKKLEAGDVAEQ
ncbi:4Fe-4S ferredoxin [Slackia equolifaciens]|uniref:4Fe-4S ferredoxin n=1 Tax=Slackia equolifaciens TaxID=498718 RepID=A0A3N0B4U3_9ACTN|nr:4Fe-4S binding protein [Slackia equolifaciens]RNL42137.1 4Fe-4S ferredoxin [Slackia equolifaciens]